MQRADRPLPGAQIYAQDLSPGDTAYKIGGCHPYLISSKNRTHQGWRGAIEGISLFSGSRTQFPPDKPCIKANVVFLERHHPHHQPEQLDLVPEKETTKKLVERALRNRVKISFVYWNGSGTTRREVYPHEINRAGRSFGAWCLLRGAARNFSFAKMTEVEILGEFRNRGQLIMQILQEEPKPISVFQGTPLWDELIVLQKQGTVKLFFCDDEIWART